MDRAPWIGHSDAMTARNGEQGYGWVTKALHWATVATLVAQFVVGWTLSDDAYDAAADRAQQRVDAFEDAGKDAAEQQGQAAEEEFEAEVESEVERREEAIDAREDSFVRTAFDDVVGLRFLGDGLSSCCTTP